MLRISGSVYSTEECLGGKQPYPKFFFKLGNDGSRTDYKINDQQTKQKTKQRTA